MSGGGAIHGSAYTRPGAPLLAVCLLFPCILVCGCDGAHPVSSPEQDAYELTLATFGDRLAVAWHGGTRNQAALYLRWTEASGNPSGHPIRLTDQSREAYEPDVEALDNDVIVAWYEKDRRDGSLTALVARFDQQGTRRWQRQLSGPGANGRNPVVRISDGEIAVAWIEYAEGSDPAVWSARLHGNGEPSSATRRIAAAGKDTWSLNAAVDAAGTLYVVYDASAGTRAKELRLLSITADSSNERLLSADDGFNSSYPDLSLQDEHAALTWVDDRDGNDEVYLFTGRIRDLINTIDTRAIRVTSTPGSSTGAYVAWNETRLGLAWCDDTGGQNEIYTQVFNSQGMALEDIRQLTHTDTQSLIPAIQPWHTGFAVAWNEYLPAGDDSPSGHSSTAASTAMLELVP